MREFDTQFLKISLIIILFIFPSVCFSTEVKRSFIAWGTNLDFIVQSNKSAEEIDNIINTMETFIPQLCLLILLSWSVYNSFFRKKGI